MITIGSKVAGYEVVAELRGGGMAVVFLGKKSGSSGLSKYAAIKAVRPQSSGDASYVAMFMDETKVAEQLVHPNVARVFEVGTHGGDYFIAMEYVHGSSLGEVLTELAVKGRKLTHTLSVWVVMEAAKGLHAAHELRGRDGLPLEMVHRDVSPQNIQLGYQGVVKLIDFGVAKFEGKAQQTVAGVLKGKFRYMAPEQARGDVVDRRTDIYALGVVLWELLTMKKLFSETEPVKLLQQVRDPVIQPPIELDSTIPQGLNDAVMLALSADPDGRPATASQFRATLAHALPDAQTVDAGEVSALLQLLMQEAIAATGHIIPEMASAVISQKTLIQVGDPSSVRAFGRMTLAHTIAMPLVTPRRSEAPNPSAAVPTSPSVERPGEMTRPSARPALPRVSYAEPSPASSGSHRLIAAFALVALLLVVGALAGVFWLGPGTDAFSGDTPEPVDTLVGTASENPAPSEREVSAPAADEGQAEENSAPTARLAAQPPTQAEGPPAGESTAVAAEGESEDEASEPPVAEAGSAEPEAPQVRRTRARRGADREIPNPWESTVRRPSPTMMSALVNQGGVPISTTVPGL